MEQEMVMTAYGLSWNVAHLPQVGMTDANDRDCVC